MNTCLFVLRFYGPVNPMGSCRAWSVYLTTRLLGRLSPLSSYQYCAHSFARKSWILLPLFTEVKFPNIPKIPAYLRVNLTDCYLFFPFHFFCLELFLSQSRNSGLRDMRKQLEFTVFDQTHQTTDVSLTLSRWHFKIFLYFFPENRFWYFM